jgi:hypothetical protein
MFKTTLTAIALAVAVVNPAHADPSLFEQGRQDRATWEQWFNGLQGDYKTGAFFWASQRSLPSPGTCRQMSDDFYAGCTQAKVRLSPSDTLRKTEPDYKAGWNAWTPDVVTTTATPAAVPAVVNPPSSPTPATAATPPTAPQSTITVLQQALDKALEAKREADTAAQWAEAKYRELEKGPGLYITDHGSFLNNRPASNYEVHDATNRWGDMLGEQRRILAEAHMRVTLANQEVGRAKSALAAAQTAERQIAEQAERDRVQAETEKAEAYAIRAAAQKAAQQQQAQAAERAERARAVAEAEAENAGKRTEALKAEAAATNEAAAKIEAARRTEAVAQAEADKAAAREKAAKAAAPVDANKQRTTEVTVAATAPAIAAAPTVPDPRPDSERAFIDAVVQARNEFRNGANDMAKGASRVHRAQALCDVLNNNLYVDNWWGTVAKLSSNNEGKGVLALAIGPDITLKTWNNSLSDMDDHTLLDPASSLYSQAVTLEKDQRVTFSGNFIRNTAAKDCVNEASLTQSGSMTDPEFVFRFSDLKP